MGDAGCTQPAYSSQVHPSETNPPSASPHISHPQFGRPEFSCQPATEEESIFRHSGWTIRRHQVYKALHRLHVRDARLDRFCNCGSALWIQKAEAGDDLRITSNKCHDRCCVPCQTERATKIRENLAQVMDLKKTRFLTLTTKHNNTPLRDQIDRLYRSFSTLRRRQSWKDHVTGGAAFLEIKLSDRDGLWHPHLHIVMNGTFWETREISREWHCVTGDSSIVKIKEITDSQAVGSYITKYVTKPFDASLYNVPNKLDEAISSLSGRRLCFTFGTWRGVKLDARPEDKTVWITVGSVENLRSNARDGDGAAQSILEAAARKWPLFAQVFLQPKGASP